LVLISIRLPSSRSNLMDNMIFLAVSGNNVQDGLNAGRLRLELRPLPFGDHLDGAVDDLDGRLFVDGVGRDADFGRPPLCLSQSIRREASRCGKIEKSTTPRVRSSGAEGHSTKYAPIRVFITMLPALTPTQTVSGSEGSRSASPDSRIQ